MKPTSLRTLWAAAIVALGWVQHVASPVFAEEPRPVLLATTTSTQDSGLLDVLVPIFEKETHATVKTIAVGTGQALALGGRGEADVVLCHAPELEKKYLAEGTMLDRRLVMHNDFVIVGPPADPAGIRGGTSAADALRRIAAAKAPFVSRGDNSGTDILEKKLWNVLGIEPKGAGWYLEAGQGMGATLRIASDKRGYTLSDRGTFLATKRGLDLEPLSQGDPKLRNVYHVMRVDPERFPRVNRAGGKAFADFLVSSEVQEIIRTFGQDKFGEPLFFPDAGAPDPD
jgi:tungstate transport system substrate-binding protein